MKKILSIAALALLTFSITSCGNCSCCKKTEKRTLSQGQVRIFSHRGGRMEFDENTVTAFEGSYEKGYRGYETDIRMASDGVLILTHDSTLERTTNGTGVLELQSSETIKALETKQGGKVMMFDEFVEWIASKGDMEYVEFELKTKPVELYPEEKLHAMCDEIWTKTQAIKPEGALFLYTSSDERGLLYLKEKYGTDDLLWIVSKPVNDETIETCLGYGIKRIGAKIEGSSRKSVQKAQEKGLIVSLWPSGSVDDIMLGIWLGSNTLCCDVPVEVKDFIEKECPYLDIEF
ncbi:MAG: glycerophosphodiester phosphodiesterase [Bacteroidales bacterium]|nr:glycerophosphodiester phosphodiesterase [Bacteroidales bacterium]